LSGRPTAGDQPFGVLELDDGEVEGELEGAKLGLATGAAG